MADVTGAYHHPYGGKTFALRLTLGGIATLQGRHGNDLGGLLSKDGIVGIPPFGLLIDIVATALQKGEGMPSAEAQDLADDMLTADQQLAAHVLEAAFPAAEGNVKPPRAAKR